MMPTQTAVLEVVTEQVEKPERADQRKRHSQQYDGCFYDGLCVQVNQDDNYHERERADE